jgi:hypothetical protein
MGHIIGEIKGIYTEESIPFKGMIEIIRQDPDHGTVYANWQAFTLGGDNIAGRSRTYFIGNLKIDEAMNSKVISLVTEDISNYRINRKNAFAEVEVTITIK